MTAAGSPGTASAGYRVDPPPIPPGDFDAPTGHTPDTVERAAREIARVLGIGMGAAARYAAAAALSVVPAVDARVLQSIAEGEREIASGDPLRTLDDVLAMVPATPDEGLRERVLALADEYQADGLRREALGRPAWPLNVARRLRAAAGAPTGSET